MDILGISFGVDGSAALVRDGRVVAASLEERFSRIKHDRSWPSAAIRSCLSIGGVDLSSIDEVAFFWNPSIQLDFPHQGRSQRYRHHGDYLHMVPSWLLPALAAGRDLPQTLLECEIEGRERPLRVRFVAHHRCHAASAFFPSPFDDAAVLTIDGYGERASTSLFHARWGAGAALMDRIDQIDFPQSLGAVYAAVTGHLGFRANSGEGKVMGLAPYGTPALVPAMREVLRVTPTGARPYDVDLSYFSYYLDRPERVSPAFVARFGPAITPGRVDDRARDLAYAIQAVTEEALLATAHWAKARTGSDNLVLAGGVAMNSCANGRLEREGPFQHVWVQPSAGDGGTAVGAALWSWHLAHSKHDRHRWVHDRFGPSYDPDSCRAALRRGGWTWDEPADLHGSTADALADGEFVGWFQGASELGARALGARSILADPRSATVRDRLNATVKYREPFRPFAPSVVAEEAGRWFDLRSPVPFMQQVHPVREEHRGTLAGVTHVDGTARLHTVSQESFPEYHALLRAFGDRTGVPVLLDTSFNVRGEPMVETPDDAIRCWATTGLHRLVLGPCVLHKGRGGAHR